MLTGRKSLYERGVLYFTLMTKSSRCAHDALFPPAFSLCAGNKAVFCRRASKLSNGKSATVRILCDPIQLWSVHPLFPGFNLQPGLEDSEFLLYGLLLFIFNHKHLFKAHWIKNFMIRFWLKFSREMKDIVSAVLKCIAERERSIFSETKLTTKITTGPDR